LLEVTIRLECLKIDVDVEHCMTVRNFQCPCAVWHTRAYRVHGRRPKSASPPGAIISCPNHRSFQAAASHLQRRSAHRHTKSPNSLGKCHQTDELRSFGRYARIITEMASDPLHFATSPHPRH